MGKGRAPCCDKNKVKRGPWSPAEDLILITFIQKHGHGNWRALPKQAGLLRCGKSCRLRWINYLRPDLRRGNFTPEEEEAIINLHNALGNKWSKIASYLPGRTDNEIKNVWNTHLKKRLTRKNAHCQKNLEVNDSPMEYSASHSCTSSTITSCGSQRLDKGDQPNDEPEAKNPNDKPEFLQVESTGQRDHEPRTEVLSIVSTCSRNLEPKEARSSDSPTSSYASSFSSFSMANNLIRPNEITGTTLDEKIEIPFDSDIDFWDMLDALDPLPPETCDLNENENSSSAGKFEQDQVECGKWLESLENDLGLTPTNPIDGDNVPNDTDQEPVTMDQRINLEPEIDAAMDYFPIWPSSPQNFGV